MAPDPAMMPTLTIAATRESRTSSRAGLYTWILPGCAILSLLGACILWSMKKPFAGDENFTRVEIADPSLAHLMRSAVHLGGGGMPLFYLTAWPWAHVFGMSELSLRMYSCVAICGAFVVLLAALRRRFGARAAFPGVAFGLFASLIVIDQSVEARGYGLYLLLASLAVAQWLRVADQARPGMRDLALLTLTQGGLVLGHVLGILYGGLMLAAIVILDGTRRRYRLSVYLWLVSGWVALVPWIPAIRASAAVGRPHSWIAVPGFAELGAGLSFWLFGGIYYPLLHAFPMGIFAGWLCAVACVAALIGAALLLLRCGSPAEQAGLVLGLALMAAPLVFFCVSRILSPIYVPRYMIPSALGIVLLAVSWARSARSTAKTILWSSVLVLLPVASAVLAKPVVLDVARIDQLAAGRPVICDWLDDFLVMTRYSAAAGAPQYPLDWQAALDGPPAAVGAYHLMENYRQAGYLTSGLRDLPAVLAEPAFVVLDNSQTNWFHLEIEKNPRFTWRVLTQVDATHRLIAVTRKS